MVYHKDRVQLLNPKSKRWVLINTLTGSIIGHKADNKPYKNVMTREERQQLHPEESIPLENVKIKVDPTYVKAHIKCDCGHYAKDHYNREGWCHHSQHEHKGGCGCTWYYPNYRWIEKQKKLARLKMI